MVCRSCLAAHSWHYVEAVRRFRRIQENFDISVLPEDAMREIRDRITASVRFNSVVQTGVPGFIPGTR
jgi:hypothetical protein